MQSIAGRRLQVVQAKRRIHHRQFALGASDEFSGKALRRLAVGDGLCPLVLERQDHRRLPCTDVSYHDTLDRQEEATRDPGADSDRLYPQAALARVKGAMNAHHRRLLCGAVRYEIAAEAPISARQCWCRVCQYFSGGGGTVNAVFNKDAIRVTGEPRVFTSIADSGAVMRRFVLSDVRHAVVQRGRAAAAPHHRAGRLARRSQHRQAGRDHLGAKSAPRWACSIPICRASRPRRAGSLKRRCGRESLRRPSDRFGCA